MSDIIIISESYEIHPATNGGYAIVSVATGEAVASFATLAEAKRAAKQYA
jgi:hypothetical protein